MTRDDLLRVARSLGKRERQDYAFRTGKAPSEVGSEVFGADADHFWAHDWKTLRDQGATNEDFTPLLRAWREAFLTRPAARKPPEEFMP